MKPTGIARYLKRKFYKYITMSRSQNNEEQIVLEYFKGTTGALLDIGANDGYTFSNSLTMIKNGWSACLVEPSEKVFPKLVSLHLDNPRVQCLNVAIGDDLGEVEFHESGGKLIPGSNSLLSTCKKSELSRWGTSEDFKVTTCEMVSFKTMMLESDFKTFRFVSIDAEGYDLFILKQIDLDEIGCECICVEHNSIPEVLMQMQNYIVQFGMRQIGYNAENIIYAK